MQKDSNADLAQVLSVFCIEARAAALLIIHEVGSVMPQKGIKLVEGLASVN